jgi:ABC-2 type transport system ATP-binding protein
MLLIKNLSKTFETIQALREVSFFIEKGALCGLLGPNGAGKSTLFKIIMGLLAPDAGEVVLAEEQIVFGATEYKRKIGYAPEAPIFYEYLTGLEFLHFIATAKGIPRATREPQIQSWLAFFDLTEKAGELIKGYSHGMRRKISLSAAMIGAPEILLLDEATNGLDPESSFKFKNYLREFCERGGTVLFSSHIIETVEHLCDRLIVLHRGQVRREMQREEWQELRQRGSSLEQEFIAMVTA